MHVSHHKLTDDPSSRTADMALFPEAFALCARIAVACLLAGPIAAAEAVDATAALEPIEETQATEASAPAAALEPIEETEATEAIEAIDPIEGTEIDADSDHELAYSMTINRNTVTGSRSGSALEAKSSARALLASGEITAAVETLIANRSRTRHDPEYDALLAASLQRDARYVDAAQLYWLIVKDNPAAGLAWVGLAIASDSLNDPTRALAAFERALLVGNLDPSLSAYARQRVSELTVE